MMGSQLSRAVVHGFARSSLASRLAVVAAACAVGVGLQITPALAGPGPTSSSGSQTNAPKPPLTEVQVWCERNAADASGSAAQAGTYSRLCGSPEQEINSPQSLPIGQGGCYQLGCTGQDPVAMGCTNPQKWVDEEYGGVSTNGTGGYDETEVALLWSQYCEANWTMQWTRGGTIDDLWATVAYQTSCGATGYYSNSCFPGYVYGWDSQPYGSGQYSGIYTNMLDGAPGQPCTGSYDLATAEDMYYLTGCY